MPARTLCRRNWQLGLHDVFRRHLFALRIVDTLHAMPPGELLSANCIELV